MAKQKDSLEKLQQKLLYFKDEIKKYKKKFLEDDGKIDSEEQKQLDKTFAVIQQIEKKVAALQKKKNQADSMCMVNEPPKALGGTSPSEFKFPALPSFLPNVSISSSGSIKYEHSFDANLHEKISKQKTFPICTGLKLGGEISIESKASLKLSIQAAYKTDPVQLPKNEWSSYQVTSSIGANISSTGKFSLVLTDSLSLLAAKFGVAVECVFNNKQIEMTNFFSGGKMTVDALVLSCSLTGSLGYGETLMEIYEAIDGKSPPDFLEWSGKKYTLLQVGVTIEATDKGVLPAAPTIGIHEGGIQALQNDITAVYEEAKTALDRIKPLVIEAALVTFPIVRIALVAYELLGNLYDYVTSDKNGFENNKEIYTKACKDVVDDLMKTEHQDPKKLREFAKIINDKKKLEAYYTNLLKKAQNIQLIKDIYDNLNKNTEEGLNDAKENLDQILTTVDLNYDSISEVKEEKDKYSVHFKVLVSTDGPVIIPSVKASISCNNELLNSSLQDSNDTYDAATKQVYDGYSVSFSKSKLEKALGKKSIADSTWVLTLHADYPGHFKDVNNEFDISKEIKTHF